MARDGVRDVFVIQPEYMEKGGKNIVCTDA